MRAPLRDATAAEAAALAQLEAPLQLAAAAAPLEEGTEAPAPEALLEQHKARWRSERSGMQAAAAVRQGRHADRLLALLATLSSKATPTLPAEPQPALEVATAV